MRHATFCSGLIDQVSLNQNWSGRQDQSPPSKEQRTQEQRPTDRTLAAHPHHRQPCVATTGPRATPVSVGFVKPLKSRVQVFRLVSLAATNSRVRVFKLARLGGVLHRSSTNRDHVALSRERSEEQCWRRGFLDTAILAPLESILFFDQSAA